MLVVIANNKGGQGKSLTAKLLTQYLLAANAKKQELICCCDLDAQQNFRKSIESWSKKTEITDLCDIEVSFFEKLNDTPGDMLCICDTPPVLNDISIDAILRADILIVPIIPGQEAAQGARRVAELRGIERIGEIRTFLNGWDNSASQKAAERWLVDIGFKPLAKIPYYKRLAYNMDAKIDWCYGFTTPQIEKFTTLFKKFFAF